MSCHSERFNTLFLLGCITQDVFHSQPREIPCFCDTYWLHKAFCGTLYMKFYPLGTLGVETSFLLTSWQSLEGSKDWPSSFCVPKGLLETAARSLQAAEAVFSLLYWHRLQSRGLSMSTPAVTLTCLSNQLQQQRIWHSRVTAEPLTCSR